jgi:transcriptional regulator GlxA family with amidase domain
MRRRRIGILGYDGIQALDLVGPAETFAAVSAQGEGGEAGYDIVIIGLHGMKFVSETGLTLHADAPCDTKVTLDTIIIPGGASMRSDRVAARTAAFVADRAPSVRRVASVCTGVYGVARTGLLDNRRVTTHWRFAEDLRRRFPKLRVDADAVFVKDGPFYSSAGITAGIDLSLAIIEEDHGPRGALSVARELVVYLRRPGGQTQFSEPLQFQLESADRFADLIAWLSSHLQHNLSVEAMAARVCLCPRQFTRVFTTAYGKTPAAFVEDMRLSEARRRLSAQRVGIEAVAKSVGYRSADVFRRAFERRYGVSARDYRLRFPANKSAGTRSIRSTKGRTAS